MAWHGIDAKEDVHANVEEQVKAPEDLIFWNEFYVFSDAMF